MPVLMVSEKTWPQWGFSRNRSMRPSSLGDDDPELERVGHPLEDDGGQGAAAAVEADHLVEVDVGQGVPGDDHEGLAEHLGGVADAAGRAQGGRLGGVGQVDAPCRSRRRSSCGPGWPGTGR
jgi:hypothetical protein